MKTAFFSSAAAFFSGAKFPVFMLAATFFYQLFLALLIFSPYGGGFWGQFVVDFRAWCFGYDQNTGWMQWSKAWIMISEPILLQAIIAYLWRDSLRHGLRFQRRELIPQVSAAFGAIVLVAAGLLWIGASDASAEEIPAFPGDRIRTALELPEIKLHNQHGDPINLEDYRGRVVLLTAIYSTCSTACPMLMIQAQRAVEELTPEEQADLTVMAISLDPENDTLELMAEAGAVYGIDAPQFQFLNGDPEVVNAILDRLNVSRIRNRTTDEIDHVNMYFLIDREGKIAFRLTLSDRHQVWLVDALRQLLNEKVARET